MTTQQELTPELIRAALTTVKFPGFSRDIVSFGLVKKIDIDAENNVTIDLVIESKNADIPRYIFEGVHGVMKHLPGVKHCDVNIEHKAPEAKKGINDDPSTWKSSVPGAKHVIAVASGKGGVGKSTVSASGFEQSGLFRGSGGPGHLRPLHVPDVRHQGTSQRQ